MKNSVKAMIQALTEQANVATESDVTVEHSVDGMIVSTKITIESCTLATVASANLGFGKKLFTFPKGNLKILYEYHDLDITAHTGCTVNPDTGIGTSLASGIITALNGTAAFEDILDGTAWGALTEGVAKNYLSAAPANGETDAKDGRTTACAAYLNMAGAWATAGTITVSGTITLVWTVFN